MMNARLKLPSQQYGMSEPSQRSKLQAVRTTELTLQTVYRIKDDPIRAEAALATWSM
jgi:hypothetical protein